MPSFARQRTPLEVYFNSYSNLAKLHRSGFGFPPQNYVFHVSNLIKFDWYFSHFTAEKIANYQVLLFTP
jgi:hypothetical protein